MPTAARWPAAPKCPLPTRRRELRLHVNSLLLLCLLFAPAVVHAQAEPWNSPRVRDLVERARVQRATPFTDTTLQNYRALATGYVYFYLDRRATDDRTLIRTDQVAVELYWAAPNLSKQRIVGMRNENQLPNRMYYHLDHLSVVQNGFGDRIRMGEGDEVKDVPHPAARGTDSIYDFRLVDSLTLKLPGPTLPVRVYEINVRPRQLDRPGFVGSIFVDRNTADIVRMNFTFTPSSYIDKRLDYINVSIDNGLWQGRYWLPHEQRLEIRRQVPELDFAVGAVIQGRLTVSDYAFNTTLPQGIFYGPPVSALPRAQREAYPFPSGIYDDLNDAGLAPPHDLGEIRSEAIRLLRQHALSGLPRLRIDIPNASSVLRYNRAEGLALGLGASYHPQPTVQLSAASGFSFGTTHALPRLSFAAEPGDGTRIDFALFANRIRDMGARPGAPGALNTLSSLLLDRDYLDPYVASGAEARLRTALGPGWNLHLGFRGERQHSATLEVGSALGSDGFRPVRPVADGELFAGRIALERTPPANDRTPWSGTLWLETGAFRDQGFARSMAEISLRRNNRDRSSALELRLAAGGAIHPPPQALFLLGGRNTLPGYAYRSFGGRSFALANALWSHDVWAPWIRFRLSAATGWSADLPTNLPASPGSTAATPPSLAGTWNISTTGRVRSSLGAGVGLFFDALRFDLVRGLDRGGSWQLLFSVPTEFWDFL